jgi:serine/threonine protein kinase
MSFFRGLFGATTLVRKTRHERILLFMGVCNVRPNLCIVTAFCENGSLYRHLHVLETHFEAIDLANFALQISQGMEYLHARKILHRDLKSQSEHIFISIFCSFFFFVGGGFSSHPAKFRALKLSFHCTDILLNENMEVKLADFGLATLKRDIRADEPNKRILGSLHWMVSMTFSTKPLSSLHWCIHENIPLHFMDQAPEVLRCGDNVTHPDKADVYSFGMILYELLVSNLLSVPFPAVIVIFFLLN